MISKLGNSEAILDAEDEHVFLLRSEEKRPSSKTSTEIYDGSYVVMSQHTVLSCLMLTEGDAL